MIPLPVYNVIAYYCFIKSFYSYSAGANISGDLKKPGYAIPFGTLAASIFTFVIYILLGEFLLMICCNFQSEWRPLYFVLNYCLLKSG